MLVVSRKRNQRIDFPNLGIAIEILRISGNTVRVGVDAPRDVRVLRGELKDADEVSNSVQPTQESEAARKPRHEFRNRMHTANLALRLLHKQLEAGRTKEAEGTLAKVIQAFEELNNMAPATKDAEANPGASETTPRALVVEDNSNERELLTGYLELCGYTVDSVEDGREALDYLSANDRPDVVLLDMQMPRMTGPETISAIRSNPNYRDVKLFAVSGMDREEMQVPLGRRGVDRWFSKPLRPAEFTRQLNAEIDWSCAD